MNEKTISIAPAKALSGDQPAEATAAPQPKAHPCLGGLAIVRCCIAGVHVGHLTAYSDDHLTLEKSRRLWSWEGAFTLSAVAARGPEKCRLGDEITVHIERADVGEIISLTPAQMAAIVEASDEA